VTQGATTWLRLLAVALCCLLTTGCPGRAGRQHVTDSGPKKLYLDANLGFGLTVSGDWPRSFVTPPAGSVAPYAVRWNLDPGNRASRTVIEVAVFAAGPEPDREELIRRLRRQFPGFELTAVSELPGRNRPQWDVLGHTGRSTFLVRYLLAGGRLFQLSLFARPEDFDAARSLFDAVTASFDPLDD